MQRTLRPSAWARVLRRRGAGRRKPAYREIWPALALRWAGRLVYGFIALSLALVLLFRYVDPPYTVLMAQERWRLGETERHWRPLEQIAEPMRRAVIAAEDANFCAHRGFDLEALRSAVAVWRGGGRLVGASTISQQTAKNVFLWPQRSLVRKALEFWFTALIEIFWGKERILEVYLNVAEFGPGKFGVAAGAEAAFRSRSDTLQLDSAARLAAVLPAPRRFDPADLPAERLDRVAAVIDGARTLEKTGGADCVRAP
ncbi:MAG: monofunctional biosynthetic peptidoglycan transglycosylase [Pseudomonadota bacterium]